MEWVEWVAGRTPTNRRAHSLAPTYTPFLPLSQHFPTLKTARGREPPLICDGADPEKEAAQLGVHAVS